MSSFFSDTNKFKPLKVLSPGAQLSFGQVDSNAVAGVSTSTSTSTSTNCKEKQPTNPLTPIRIKDKPTGSEVNQGFLEQSRLKKEKEIIQGETSVDDGTHVTEVREVSKDQQEQQQSQALIKTNRSSVSTSDALQVAQIASSPDPSFSIYIQKLKDRLDEATNNLTNINMQKEQNYIVVNDLQNKLDQVTTKLFTARSKIDSQNQYIQLLKEKNDEISGQLSEEKLRCGGLLKNVDKLVQDSNNQNKKSIENVIKSVQKNYSEYTQKIISEITTSFHKTMETQIEKKIKETMKELNNKDLLNPIKSSMQEMNKQNFALWCSFAKQHEANTKDNLKKSDINKITISLKDSFSSKLTEIINKEEQRSELFDNLVKKLDKQIEVEKPLNRKISQLEGQIKQMRTKETKLVEELIHTNVELEKLQVKHHTAEQQLQETEQELLQKDELLQKSTDKCHDFEMQVNGYKQVEARLEKEISDNREMLKTEVSKRNQVMQDLEMIEQLQITLKDMNEKLSNERMTSSNLSSELRKANKSIHKLNSNERKYKSQLAQIEESRLYDKEAIDVVHENKKLQVSTGNLENQLTIMRTKLVQLEQQNQIMTKKLVQKLEPSHGKNCNAEGNDIFELRSSSPPLRPVAGTEAIQLNQQFTTPNKRQLINDDPEAMMTTTPQSKLRKKKQ